MKVLVTGVGAIIGQGIVKSLRRCGDVFVVGVSSVDNFYGKKLVDRFYLVHETGTPEWRRRIKSIYKKENIRLVFPGIHQDMIAYSKMKGIAAVVNTPQAISLGTDKWELYQFASKNKIDMPYSFIPEKEVAIDVPVVWKMRNAYSGKGQIITKTKTASRLAYEQMQGKSYLIQQYIGSDDEEYTVGIYGYKDSLSEPIIMRRKLNYGSTFEAEVIRDKKLSNVSTSIAEKIGVRGPTNMQFRKLRGRYYLIDFNPRISSSTSIRAHFGFNEANIALEDFMNGKKLLPKIKTGKCHRYIGDYYGI